MYLYIHHTDFGEFEPGEEFMKFLKNTWGFEFGDPDSDGYLLKLPFAQVCI
jgi:hypothetical protein